MSWTDIFIKRPVLSVVVSLLILLIGFRAAMVLPIRQYPKLSNTVVNVTTVYPGASAALISGFITTPIEQAVASAEGVDYITSSSVQGTSTIQVYIKLNFDPNQALTEVLAKVNSVKYLIPKESNDPVVTKTTGQTTAVMYLGFSSEELSGSAISDYLTRVVQPVLSTVDGVASADILGGQTFAVRLWLDPVKMAGRGVSPNDVPAAIAANNFQAAAGQAKGYLTVSNVSTNTDLQNVQQFKRMIVKSKDGGFVRMEDIATVELAAQSSDASVAFNGEHAIFIGVQATPQGNPLTLVKGVRALFPELERNLPPSMKMKVAYDSTRFIQSSIDEVEKTLGQAVLIVVVVIFLFLASFRSVVIPVVTIPLSPMMCSVFLKSAEEGRFARIVNRVFGSMTRWYGRQLDRSLDYRPITGLFALTILGLVGFLYLHTPKELAPEEDQGIVFAVIKAPKYANIDYLDFYSEKLDHVFASFPETDLRFALNGINGAQNGIAGMLLKPWDERKRSSIKLKPLVQGELSKIEGVNAFAFNLPPLPGGPGGLPVQMVINSTSGFQAVYEQMLKLKDAARKSGLFIVSDSDLDFNQPIVRVKIDRSKASDLGINMANIGNTLATLLGGNYVNRFNLEGRSYQVIPQVPRDQRLSREALGGYYVPTTTGQQVPLSTIVSIETGTDPNALTHYNQLNSATFQAVPMPGVTVGQAVDFLEGEAKKLPAGFSRDYLADCRQYVQEGNHLAITFGFALIIIFVVLAAQFESLRDPLVIMISVPMAIVGALLPLFFGAATMNIYTQVGLLTLVGLISKHGILMVEFANELQLNEGLDKRSAIEMAARIRLRPILMTTTAMVTGLLPPSTASGPGAARPFSIGLVVAAGMSIGTLFTLFVLPAVYVAIATDHRAGAESQRAKEIADFDLGAKALKPT